MATTSNLLERVQSHLQTLQGDPSTDLDERLFESCTLALPQSLSKDQSISLIQQLSSLLPTLQTDPTPAINFLVPLLQPFSFSDISSLGPVDFTAGLDVRAVPYNRLMLAILQKATSSPSDAATVAAQPEVASALIKLWLTTQDAGIASEASNVLVALLAVDLEPEPVTPPEGNGQTSKHGQGLVWRRVFSDKDVYGLIFSICSLKVQASGTQLTKGQKTLAQARLLEWLPKIGVLNWQTITRSHHSNVESEYMPGTGASLLQYAAMNMVDVKDDVLMHRCLIDFFADLLSTVRQKEGTGSLQSSVSLEFLIGSGLHARVSSLFLDPTNPQHDPLDLRFLYGASCNYISVYASTYPEHFLASDSRGRTLARLKQNLDFSSARWAHAESPKNDLHLLASLPRVALFPTGSDWSSSPLSLVPSRMTNPDALNTLATVFHGPRRDETITYPAGSPMTNDTDPQTVSEAAAARALYFLYLNYNPGFFEHLVNHAETIALKDQALAALNALTGVITANWRLLPESTDDTLPTENEFISWLPSPPTATPASGVLAVLAPPSLEHTLPYLLRPAQTFSNLVGGRGDPESSAYKVAMAKFDALKAMHNRLQDQVAADPGQGYEDIMATLAKQIAIGPWNKQAEVGGRIATLEL
ncbi:hypothetical protein H2203_000808 [Taxawa tesnikishii (nom. ined.)]|nr:hypothetical protein H2203_000808 [Dothideales sp. JES 119]